MVIVYPILSKIDNFAEIFLMATGGSGTVISLSYSDRAIGTLVTKEGGSPKYKSMGLGLGLSPQNVPTRFQN